MTHNIKKQNIFNFLRAQKIVQEIKSSTQIFETNPNSFLTELNITNLNSKSNYWQILTENKTFIEPNSKKVDGIIIEETEDKKLKIVLIELKSKDFKYTDIIDKFEKSISWVYLLLNLLGGKENKEIQVYGILVAQKNVNWNEKGNLTIFNSTSIRYIKRSFYTTETSLNIDYNEMIKKII